MIAAILVSCSLALVSCQHPTHPTHPPTHHPHEHPTHPATQQPHEHPTHEAHTKLPEIDHTFNADNAVFLKDLDHKVMILKTDSGCYVAHLNEEQIKHVDDAEKLLHLEAQIIHQARESHHFVEALNTKVYSDEIQQACPKILAYHHEH